MSTSKKKPSERKRPRPVFSWAKSILEQCHICECVMETKGGIKVEYYPGMFGAYCLDCVRELGEAAATAPMKPRSHSKVPPKKSRANTHGLSPDEVLTALYHHAKTEYKATGFTLDEARGVLTGSPYVGNLHGRSLNVMLSTVTENYIDAYAYDASNGNGIAQFALDNYHASSPAERDAKYHRA